MSSYVILAVFQILLYYCDFLRHITKYYDILRHITTYYDILRHLRQNTTYHDILQQAIIHFRTFFAQSRTFFLCFFHSPISHLLSVQTCTFFVQFCTFFRNQFLPDLAPKLCPMSHQSLG